MRTTRAGWAGGDICLSHDCRCQSCLFRGGEDKWARIRWTSRAFSGQRMPTAGSPEGSSAVSPEAGTLICRKAVQCMSAVLVFQTMRLFL